MADALAVGDWTEWRVYTEVQRQVDPHIAILVFAPLYELSTCRCRNKYHNVELPQLVGLNLSFKNLRHMAREVEALITACDAHCEEWVGLNLKRTGLSKEFIKRCRYNYHKGGIYWSW